MDARDSGGGSLVGESDHRRTRRCLLDAAAFAFLTMTTPLRRRASWEWEFHIPRCRETISDWECATRESGLQLPRQLPAQPVLRRSARTPSEVGRRSARDERDSPSGGPPTSINLPTPEEPVQTWAFGGDRQPQQQPTGRDSRRTALAPGGRAERSSIRAIRCRGAAEVRAASSSAPEARGRGSSHGEGGGSRPQPDPAVGSSQAHPRRSGTKSPSEPARDDVRVVLRLVRGSRFQNTGYRQGTRGDANAFK